MAESVDILIHGGTIVTMNDHWDVIEEGALVIRGHEVLAIGATSDLKQRYHAEQMIDASGMVVMPGLVNAHTHAAMTLLRGLADDLRLDVWLMGYIMPVERDFVDSAFCRLGTQLACAEMIRGGVTTFADMYYFEADVAQATAESGLRALLSESILKFPSPDASTYEESLAYTRRFIEEWRNHPLITPTVAPHAPYSNTDETLQLCRDLAKEFGLPLITHIAETRREVDDNLAQHGKTVVPYVKQLGLFEVPVLAAHCVHIDEHEMRIMQKAGASIAHCPSANLKLASGIAPVTQMLSLGVNVAIGTDGPASNNDLDMFEEMRLAALLAKVTPNNPTSVPARQALYMATRAGAIALGMENRIGSLEVGKCADLIVLDAEPVHNVPHFSTQDDSVYSRIVYAGKSSDVRHVICHGRVLMRDRELLTVDEHKLKQEAAVYAERIGNYLARREQDVLSKLIAVGVDVERSESFEVQTKAVLRDPSDIEKLLSHEMVEVLRAVHYRQYDTYFLFGDPSKGRVRYREDDRIDASGNVEAVRMRLTFTTGEKERVFNEAVLLSHSRFIAPASHPLRFYQEFFQASEEKTLHKERRRWRLLYKDTLFFVNVDRLIDPAETRFFVEIKSRTWSLTDAENKAAAISEMLDILDISKSDVLRQDYLEMATD